MYANFFVAILIVCGCLYIFMGIIALMKDSKSKVNRIFLVICLNLCFWAFTYSWMTATADKDIALLCRRLNVISWSTLFFEILYFTIYLTKKNKVLKTIWYHIALFLPAIICFYLYYFVFYKIEKIARVPFGWVLIQPTTDSVLYNYFFYIYYLSYTLASILLILNWRKGTKLTREKKQANIIITSTLINFILGTIIDVVFPQIGITSIPSLSVVLFIIPIGGICYSVYKYGLMSINTQKVVLDIVKIMDEGLIILDEDKKIEEVNNGVLKILGYEGWELITHPIEKVFANKSYLLEIDSFESTEIEIIAKNNATISVLISSTVVLDNYGDKIGTVLIFQDYSKIKEFENKLKSINSNLEKKVKERTNEIQMLALKDQLTDLPNRRWFNSELEKTILSSRKNRNKFAVLFIDLDSFKMINDTMGHASGDQLLIKLAIRMSKLLNQNEVIARVGGDEFFVLLDNIDSNQYVEEKCKKIIEVIREPVRLLSNEIYMNCSIGISIYPDNGVTVDILVKHADIAMYKAKENKEEKFVFFSLSMKNNLDEIMKLTNDLNRALDNNEFEVYYQPQVNSKTGQIAGLEALLRWNHPELGLLGPNIFIPIAEKTGLIISMGQWVLKTACKQIKDWQTKGFAKVSIGVNISVNQIQSNKILSQVNETLRETKLNPKWLELEITENIFMNDIDYVINTLEGLKDQKVRIAIDDFGTEYSTLSYLKKLPIDRIKIPKCFIDGINDSIVDESIISAIIGVGKKIGVNIIAEGVETIEQKEFLKKLECEEIQGYYYYKPMPAADIEKLLKNSLI